MDVTASNFTQDVTPNSSFNTIQFQSETANVIVSSILVTLILTNIGSIVSKVVLRSPLTTFPFHSFRRFIIFETTDDPFRLLNWLRGNNRYRDKSWKRKPHMVRLKYLLLPLSARVLLIVASIVSIAITIPTQQTLSGCDNGDFQPTLDALSGQPVFAIRCNFLPLASRLGSAKSTLEFCSFIEIRSSSLNSTNPIARVTFLENGGLRWEIEAQGRVFGLLSFIQWKQVSGRVFNSLPSLSISPDQVLDGIMDALGALGFQCRRGATIPLEKTEGVISGAFMASDGCVLDPLLNISSAVQGILTGSLQLKRVQEPQLRYDISSGQQSTICPIDVVVQQPLVNILPLSVLLAVIFSLNMMFTWITGKHGGVLESYFHVVKELFGRDCMSNPLEESEGAVNEGDKLALMTVVRGEAGHVGYLRRNGDVMISNSDSLDREFH